MVVDPCLGYEPAPVPKQLGAPTEVDVLKIGHQPFIEAAGLREQFPPVR